MKRIIVALISAIVTTGISGTAWAQTPLSEMIQQVRPSVVKVDTDLHVGATGFIVATTDEDGAMVLTNHHVLDEATYAEVRVFDRVWYEADVLWLDPRRDVGMLYICCNSEFSSVEFEDTDDMLPGDEVIAIGYPTGQTTKIFTIPGRVIIPDQATVTRGIISAFRYSTVRDAQLVQIDAAINGGNSGGPLLSRDGKVVAMNTFGRVDTEGINFSILETTLQERIRIWANGPSAKFGPEKGQLGNLDAYWAPEFATDADEFAVEVEFTNPFSASRNQNWEYGIMFGDNGTPGDSSLFYWVDSRRNWYVHRLNADGSFDLLHSGRVPQLVIRDGGTNQLSLMVDGQYAWLYVNGLKVQDSWGLPMPTYGTGFILEGSHEGEVGIYTSFRGWNPVIIGKLKTHFSGFVGHTYDHQAK